MIPRRSTRSTSGATRSPEIDYEETYVISVIDDST